jgi:predicted nucleotidyltransferase
MQIWWQRATRAISIRRNGFVKNTFVNIAGKLPRGLVALYGDIGDVAKSLAIDFLVVGAMARDLVLVHGFGSTIERGTRDVDFGINVASWEEFETLKAQLIEQGFEQDKQKAHRLTRSDSQNLPWEVDIVPFGNITVDDSTISWPPDQAVVMSVLGFTEAMENAFFVQISDDPEMIIPVASPAGVAILKLVAWIERAVEVKPKDAMDLGYLIESYTKIPEIFAAVYEEGCMEAQDWDETKASAMKLGRDAGVIALPPTKTYLKGQLFNQPQKVEQFVRQMRGPGHISLPDSAELLDIFAAAFLHQEMPQ